MEWLIGARRAGRSGRRRRSSRQRWCRSTVTCTAYSAPRSRAGVSRAAAAPAIATCRIRSRSRWPASRRWTPPRRPPRLRLRRRRTGRRADERVEPAAVLDEDGVRPACGDRRVDGLLVPEHALETGVERVDERHTLRLEFSMHLRQMWILSADATASDPSRGVARICSM